LVAAWLCLSTAVDGLLALRHRGDRFAVFEKTPSAADTQTWSDAQKAPLLSQYDWVKKQSEQK
jgi:hypothetical protein